MIDFWQGVFDVLDYDKHVIAFEEARRDDMLKMFEFKARLLEGDVEKTDTPPHADNEHKIRQYKESNEDAQEDKRGNVELPNNTLTIENIFKSKIADILEEKNIDIAISSQTYEYLNKHEKATTQEIVNYIHETIDPDDFNNDKTPLKINTHLNRMFMHDLLEFNAPYYELTQEFIDLVGGEQ